ncbi:MAG: hypothetical protein INR62_08580, partial [Rhodospirillales bacterium]|nr:hypothetical protein [Acetobacter sp.]
MPTPSDDGADGIPVANLSNASDGYVYTDCSGWVSFALDSVAPLHQAVAATARTQPKFNHDRYHEATRHGWSRAFVLADLFKTADGSNGFIAVSSFADLQAGDIIAYAHGQYADPADNKGKGGGDTGHTMIVAGAPRLVSRTGARSNGQDPSPQVVKVYAVPVVDSSNLEHFTTPEGDQRQYTTTPADAPAWLGNQRGGTGAGTIWFGVDKDGNVVQWRFDSGDPWQPPAGSGEKILVGAARLTDTIDLSHTALNHGALDVRVYPNASPVLGGTNYAAHEVLTGTGNLQVTGGGTLSLGRGNSFKGAMEVGGGTTLDVASDDSLGSASNALTLDDGATLRFSSAMTFNHDVSLGGNATIDLGGNLVDLTGVISGTGTGVLTVESSTPSGEAKLAGGIAGLSEVVVQGGAVLSLMNGGMATSSVALESGATLHVSQTSILREIRLSGAATLDVEGGAQLTLSYGVPQGESGTGFGSLTLTGSGTLAVNQGFVTEAVLTSGDTLFVGS